MCVWAVKLGRYSCNFEVFIFIEPTPVIKVYNHLDVGGTCNPFTLAVIVRSSEILGL